jgi:hypothetical protein
MSGARPAVYLSAANMPLRGTQPDRFAPARAVADAVLYEGYVLYPYRASSKKNQVRFQFGVLAPRTYAESEGSESCTMRAECIAETGTARAALHVRVRCLHVQSRVVEALGRDGTFAAVQSLDVAGQLYTSWDESAEQEIECPPVHIDELLAATGGAGGAGGVGGAVASGAVTAIDLPAWSEIELIDGGRIVRTRRPIAGAVSLRAADLGFGLVKIEAEVSNETAWSDFVPRETHRDEAVRHSLVAVHILIGLDGARFVSLVDPPERARRAVGECHSVGCFPVLCGSGRDDVMLAAPIILYDHPEVAPESPGDMCDATEIDEILALRTLTLTEEEKREARATDPRSAAIIDRVDSLPPEIFERLHGAIRSVGPARAVAEPAASPHFATDDDGFPVFGRGAEPAGLHAPARKEGIPWWDPGADSAVDPETDTIAVGRYHVGRGTRVRLHPHGRSDAQDIFVAGKLATVAGVFHDVDGDVHLAVTIDDDPATEMHEWYGRFRYFHPEELEVVEGAQ